MSSRHADLPHLRCLSEAQASLACWRLALVVDLLRYRPGMACTELQERLRRTIFFWEPALLIPPLRQRLQDSSHAGENSRKPNLTFRRFTRTLTSSPCARAASGPWRNRSPVTRTPPPGGSTCTKATFSESADTRPENMLPASAAPSKAAHFGTRGRHILVLWVQFCAGGNKN
eukprot:TRINITY_DN21882_c1_g1_i3.p1 TRINITY_DN21882_c1_g1~~TRINITY_DN21882_c1_g1_i3.p1  ORF type:complete len:197 (-),score=19.50 TRINITY_DN21882_c1_g1_i3:29-547(-)